MAKKSSAKKSSAKKSSASSTRPAHWPDTVNGRKVVGETADGGAWVTNDETGATFHEAK